MGIDKHFKNKRVTADDIGKTDNVRSELKILEEKIDSMICTAKEIRMLIDDMIRDLFCVVVAKRANC